MRRTLYKVGGIFYGFVFLNACASFNVKNLAENPSLSNTCYLANGAETVCFDRPTINSEITLASEADFENAFQSEPWYQKNKISGAGQPRPNIALAAGGGGTKASAFAMGVLKRLVDDGQIDEVDVISSVSGGGHAVAFLYSRADYARKTDKIIGCDAENHKGDSPEETQRIDMEQLKCLYVDLRQVSLPFPYGPRKIEPPLDDDPFSALKTNHYVLTIPSNDLIAYNFENYDRINGLKIKEKEYNLGKICEHETEKSTKCIGFNLSTTPSDNLWTPANGWVWASTPEKPFWCYGLQSSLRHKNKAIQTGAHLSFTWNRCWQDMMSKYSTELRKKGSSYTFAAIGGVSQVGLIGLTAGPHHVSNTLFDWNLQLSPLYKAQKHGNERMGLTFQNDLLNDENTSKPYTVNYADLRQLESFDLPMWALNTTTPTSAAYEFSRTDLTEMDEHRFEFTPYGFGSHKYGFMKNNEQVPDIYAAHNLDLPKAYSASYAFLDPRQRVKPALGNILDVPLGLVAQNFIHGINIGWDIAIANYNMQKTPRQMYNILPAPLNYYSRLDEQKFRPIIHLGDGGINRDGIGFIPLLERRAEKIIAISEDGSIGALCQLDVFLKSKGLQLKFNGSPLAFNDTVDDDKEYKIVLDTLCTTDGWKEDKKKNLDPQKWTKLIWRGKIYPCTESAVLCKPAKHMQQNNPRLDTEIFFINSHIYQDDKERCLKAVLDNSKGGNLSARSKASHKAKTLSGEDDFYSYPPSLCAWMHRNMRDVNEFPAHEMALITLDSSQEISMAYMDLGWYIAGGLMKPVFKVDKP